MKRSESIMNIAKALSTFQGLVKQPKKNSMVSQNYQDKNGKWQKKEYKYSTLDELINAIKEPLEKCGLSYLQDIHTNGEVVVKTLLMHESGEWIESSTIQFKVTDMKPQSIGSLITYGKRYSLSSMLGLASEEDDDGNIEQQEAEKPIMHKNSNQVNMEPPKTEPKKEAKSNLITMQQLKKLNILISQMEVERNVTRETCLEVIKRYYGHFESMKEMTIDQASKAIKHLDEFLNKVEEM